MSALTKYITSNNLFFFDLNTFHKMESSFFGFALTENEICIRTRPESVNPFMAGTFVDIVVDNEKISVTQDYHCGFGLYV